MPKVVRALLAARQRTLQVCVPSCLHKDKEQCLPTLSSMEGRVKDECKVENGCAAAFEEPRTEADTSAHCLSVILTV